MVDESHQAPIHGSCPDPEAIAALVDGRLSGAEKAAVEKHLASCEDCYTIFSETARSEDELAAAIHSPVVRGRFGRRWIVLAAAAALVAAAIPLAVTYRAKRRVRPDVAELVAAVGAQRPFEPRLTGGFEFGPMAPRYRSAKPLSESDSWEVLAAAAKIRKKDEEHSTPATLDALGAANLILGKYDDAVSNLEEATLEEPKNAHYLTDLSAAYLVRAKERDRADDYPKALEAAEKATELDASILEAWFNRALALDELPLKSEAAKAWQDYLNRDSKSGWAVEAKKRLAAIRAIANHAEEWKKAKAKMLAAAQAGNEKTLRAIMPDWCQETREWIEEDLLPELGVRARTTGLDALEPPVCDVDRLVSVYSALTRDETYSTIIKRLDDSALRPAFSENLTLFRSAREAYRDSEMDRASADFRAIASSPAAAGTGLVDLSRLYAEAADFFRGHLVASAETVSGLVADADAKGEIGIAGQARWLQASIRLSRGDPAGAVESYGEAAKRTGSIGSRGDTASIRSLRAQALHDLGDEEGSWKDARRALASADFVNDPDRGHTLFSSLALDGIARDLPAVALHLQNTAIAREAGASPVVRAESLIFFSRIPNLKRRKDLAEKDLSRARRLLARVDDPGLSRRLLADLLAAEVETGSLQGREGIREISESVRLFDAAETRYYHAHLLLTRGRLYRDLGDDARAGNDFDAGIRDFEGDLSRDGRLASSHFDLSRPLFENAAVLEFDSEHDPARALDYVERMRCRPLLESLAPGGHPLDIDRIRRTLSDRERLVYFLMTERQLYSWAVSRAGVSAATVRVPRDEIERIVNLARRECRRGIPAESRPFSRRLYGILIRPIENDIGRGSTMLLVPDGSLGAVPFSALVNGRTGRFLVEDHSIGIVPSGSFVERTRRASARARYRSILTVATGASPESVSEAGSLPKAEDEAESVRALYASGQMLLGPAATRDAFLSTWARFDVVHFAGHAAASADDPELSRLVFDDTNLYGRDVVGYRLPHASLVVLAACSTGDGPASAGEGVLGLARPFLSAGARAVVASLWEIEDDASRDLMVSFHRALHSTLDPLSALAAAQRRAIAGSGGRRSDVWAAFEVFSASPTRGARSGEES